MTQPPYDPQQYPTQQYQQPVYAPPQQPYYGPIPRQRPKRRMPAWLLPTGIGIVALLIGVGIGASTNSSKSTAATTPSTVTNTVTSTATTTVSAAPVTVTAPAPAAQTVTVTAPAKATSAPAAASFTDGTFVVGTDIKPGIYRTSVGSDTCYWARLSSLDGSFSSILANGDPTGPTSVQVKSTDKAFETSGGCTWTKTG